MYEGLHSNWTLSGCMYHRFGIITESDMIRSRELTNTLKPVGIGLGEVFAGVEWRSEVTSDFSMFCCWFLCWAGWATSAGEVDSTVQLGQFPVLMRKGGQVWLAMGCLLHTIRSGDASSADGPWVSIQLQCLWLQIVECLIHCTLSV